MNFVICYQVIVRKTTGFRRTVRRLAAKTKVNIVLIGRGKDTAKILPTSTG